MLEKVDCPIVVVSATVLQVNTLIAEKATFKNEGVLEAFITVLQDYATIENKGKFHARNLFLFKTDLQNYGMIMWDDVFKAVDGKIIPKAANSDFSEKKGFIQTGVPTITRGFYRFTKRTTEKRLCVKGSCNLRN